jgi:etoposide-induced 2.4 mRNA
MCAVLRGFRDSLKGAVIIFSLDKNIKKRAIYTSPNKDHITPSRRKELRREISRSVQEEYVVFCSNFQCNCGRTTFLNSVGFWFVHVILLFREPKVLKRTLQCCALNGGIFWCSLLVFECGLLPLLNYLLTILFGHSSSTGKYLWSWMKLFLSWTFGAFWVLPLFLLSKIVNSLWFQVIINCSSLLYIYCYFFNYRINIYAVTLNFSLKVQDL